MIIFKDWNIRISGLLGRQFDNLSRRIDVVGVPDGWDWDVLVKANGAMDIIRLFPTENGVGVELTRDQLSVGGTYYFIQVRGTMGDAVKHTNVIQAYVSKSLSGDGQWPTIPSEFTQLEQRIRALNSHPPIPGENGFWQLWNPDTDQHEDSEFPLPEGGTDGYSDSVRYGEAQDMTEEQQLQARKNIGAGTSDFSGSYKDLKDKPEIPTAPVQYVEQALTKDQKTQARQNIGAAGSEEVSKLSADKLDANKLPEAVNDALAQAKASGEFDGAPGKDGEDGKDGYTPVKGVDYFDGAQGPAGPAGKTPEKGVDYFTDEDKSAMVSDVLAALPTWTGGAY